MLEPELLAIEILLAKLEAQIQSLHHGLGVAEKRIESFAEQLDQWRSDVQKDT